jgi:hypothetical protein
MICRRKFWLFEFVKQYLKKEGDECDEQNVSWFLKHELNILGNMILFWVIMKKMDA